jgi:hypothetical protein
VRPNRFLELKDDYERIYDKMVTTSLAEPMFKGFESVVEKTIDRLRKNDCDILICIPLKQNCELESVFSNLKKIDLPLKTGILLGCENDNDVPWSRDLNYQISQIASRYQFIEPVTVTRARNVEEIPNMRFWIRLFQSIQRKAGIMNPSKVFYIKVVREELRLVAKMLQCKYIFWFDADVVLPSKIIPQMLRYVGMADIVAPWAINRHFTHNPTESFTSKPYKLKTDRDRAFYSAYDRITQQMLEELRKTRIANSDLLAQMVDMIKGPSSGGYAIPPWYLEAETDPIELLWTGFSCVLCTKRVNDKASFITRFATTEDYDFCFHAKERGFKIIVDPTCKVGHIREANDETVV